MTGTGRPLRFLLLVLSGWTGMRAWQSWPDSPLPPAIRDALRHTLASTPPTTVPPATAVAARHASAIAGAVHMPVTVKTTAVGGDSRPTRKAESIAAPPTRVAGYTPVEKDTGIVVGLLGLVRYGTPAPAEPATRRWSASAWTIMRGSGPAAGVATPQLGGSQAGLRVARTLDAAGRFAIAGRVAAAIGTRQQEAALGVEWRPTALPVRMVAERRFGVANLRSGTALGVVGGVSDTPLPAGFRLDGYAQAGAVARDGVEGYADGALSAARRVAGRSGGLSVSLGVGLWGAAQRGAARLDAGPAVSVAVPIGGTPRLRVALEWRQRLAGNASPASAPALSVGTDF